MKIISLTTIIVLVATAVLMSTAFCFGADPIIINSCYSNKSGALRYVDSPSQCKSNETPLSWNQAGPQGPPGDLATAADLTLNISGFIPAGYQGTVSYLYLKDVPNIAYVLKQRLGVDTLTLADIQAHVRYLGLTVETYDSTDPATATFQGFRWARVMAGPTGTNETDIRWYIMVTSDISGVLEDTDLTYKLVHVTAYLK